MSDAIIGVTYFSAIDPADFGRFDAAFVSLFKVPPALVILSL